MNTIAWIVLIILAVIIVLGYIIDAIDYFKGKSKGGFFMAINAILFTILISWAVTVINNS